MPNGVAQQPREQRAGASWSPARKRAPSPPPHTAPSPASAAAEGASPAGRRDDVADAEARAQIDRWRRDAERSAERVTALETQCKQLQQRNAQLDAQLEHARHASSARSQAETEQIDVLRRDVAALEQHWHRENDLLREKAAQAVQRAEQAERQLSAVRDVRSVAPRAPRAHASSRAPDRTSAQASVGAEDRVSTAHAARLQALQEICDQLSARCHELLTTYVARCVCVCVSCV